MIIRGLVSARSAEQTLRPAGIERAATLALTYGDDQMNMTAALPARSINPSVRLVIRMFNRDRGRHLEHLPDRAAAYTRDGDSSVDASHPPRPAPAAALGAPSAQR